MHLGDTVWWADQPYTCFWLDSCPAGGRSLSNGVNPGTFPVPAANGSLVHSLCRVDMLRKRINKTEKWKLTLTTHTYSYVGSEMLSSLLSRNKYTQLAVYVPPPPPKYTHTHPRQLLKKKTCVAKIQLGDKKRKSFLYSRFWRFSSGPWGLCLALASWLAQHFYRLTSKTISSFLQKHRRAQRHQSSCSSTLDNQGSKGQMQLSFSDVSLESYTPIFLWIRFLLSCLYIYVILLLGTHLLPASPLDLKDHCFISKLIIGHLETF